MRNSVNHIQQEGATPMSTTTTTNEEATILEDHLTETSTNEHPARTVHAPLPRQRRTALRWFAGGIVTSAAALGSLLIVSDNDTSVKHVEVTEVTLDNNATELDIHGIPTSWSQQGGAPRSEDVTELDVHGIPTWWSAGAPAP
jgi:hypothetical protein